MVNLNRSGSKQKNPSEVEWKDLLSVHNQHHAPKTSKYLQ